MTSPAATIICTICKKAVARDSAAAKAFGPFCSARCRQVDLGKWLNEDYRVSAEPDHGSEDGENASGDDTEKGA